MENKHQLYLVTVPQGPVLKLGQQLQSYLSDTYHVYNREKPPLHMTIEVISYQNEQQVQSIIKELQFICNRHRKFSVAVNGFSCFSPPYKAVNMHVEPSQPLLELSNDINLSLRRQGVSVRPSPDLWDFHITLVNTVFADREWTMEEFAQTCNVLKLSEFQGGFTVESLELWYPWYQPQLDVAGTFILRD